MEKLCSFVCCSHRDEREQKKKNPKPRWSIYIHWLCIIITFCLTLVKLFLRAEQKRCLLFTKSSLHVLVGVLMFFIPSFSCVAMAKMYTFLRVWLSGFQAKQSCYRSLFLLHRRHRRRPTAASPWKTKKVFFDKRELSLARLLMVFNLGNVAKVSIIDIHTRTHTWWRIHSCIRQRSDQPGEKIDGKKACMFVSTEISSTEVGKNHIKYVSYRITFDIFREFTALWSLRSSDWIIE